MSKRKQIIKVLSANDTGETGAHQAGMCVPKREEILSFFPALDGSTKNPRKTIDCYDKSGQRWELQWIYYNNKFYGGTRNEYRLTCLTRFTKQNGLTAGDSVILERTDSGLTKIGFQRKNELQYKTESEGNSERKILKLGNSWKIIDL